MNQSQDIHLAGGEHRAVRGILNTDDGGGGISCDSYVLNRRAAILIGGHNGDGVLAFIDTQCY